MTRDEETRLWIKTHLRQIERPEEVEDYLRAYRYLDSRRGTSVIAVPDHWHDGDKVTVRISKKTNEKEKEK